MESLLVIDLTFSAILMAISSPSIAQGPAIKKKLRLCSFAILARSLIGIVFFGKLLNGMAQKRTLGKNLRFGYDFENFSPFTFKNFPREFNDHLIIMSSH